MKEKFRLLIAEDELDLRMLLQRTLTREGFDVETAANGRDALRILKTNPDFDLLITDIKMPEKDGEQLMEEARALCPDLKVVLITGYAELQQHYQLMKKGAFDYVTKPFKIPDLLEVIDRATGVDG
ncbi:MAG: response regulator [Candidatus Sumerlaeia bacterium]|nr:response regulator [Candidatus Sumerlaeia bacterium]